MKTLFKLSSSLLLPILFLVSCASAPHAQRPKIQSAKINLDQDPAEMYGELFQKVQTLPVYADSKYFVDMIPKVSPALILQNYAQQKPASKAELQLFLDTNFFPPLESQVQFHENPKATLNAHIKMLWSFLKRKPAPEGKFGSSLIPLPFPYIVPGGRFREIYYWDSYFTQLGLIADHEDELFQDMVKNFSQLITTQGRVPNGNRTYYLGRSQPPFFSYMVSLWQKKFGAQSALQFLPALKAEYQFWMDGSVGLPIGESHARVVRLGDDEFLNRYWDDKVAPRPEAYKEDLALAQKAKELFNRDPEETFTELRSGAESGWDYSTRWFADPREFASIQTTSLLPVDLNCLLYHLELKLANLSLVAGDQAAASIFRERADRRNQLIQKYMWDGQTGTFRDYNWRSHTISSQSTVATVVPLFAGLATEEQAHKIANVLKKDFLKAGGLVTTLYTSGQQWDAPNGWAPHQWMAYAGLRKYKENALATEIRARWLKINEETYQHEHRLMEKYNVIDLSKKSGGGEYPSQDGFGWTNGVYRALTTAEESLQHLEE